MSVYVDRGRYRFRGMVMCHMIADSLDELHEMARSIGLIREWFQGSPPASMPHYDISQSKRRNAIGLGAIDCDRNTFVAHVRRIREEMKHGEGKEESEASDEGDRGRAV